MSADLPYGRLSRMSRDRLTSIRKANPFHRADGCFDTGPDPINKGMHSKAVSRHASEFQKHTEAMHSCMPGTPEHSMCEEAAKKHAVAVNAYKIAEKDLGKLSLAEKAGRAAYSASVALITRKPSRVATKKKPK